MLRFVPGNPKLAYQIKGDGPPLIFLHGIGGNKDNWTRQMDFFCSTNTVVAWDARGYGNSDDYDGSLDFRDFSHDLLRLIDHLGFKKSHLCGLSMGGRIILDFWEVYPDRVISLALVDTFPGFDDSFSMEGREKFIRERRQPLVEHGKEPADIAPLVVPGLVGPNASKEVIDELIISMNKLHKFSYIKAIESMTRYEQVTDVSEIDIPVQIIVGEEDKLTPPSISRKMHEQIKNCRLAIIPESGHLPNIEKPVEFNASLKNFLEEVGP